MAKRNLQIDLVRDPDTGAVLNRDEVRQAFLDIEGACHQLGGKIHAAPIRYDMGNGDYITTGWLFEWDSTAPSVRAPEVEQAQPEESEVVIPGDDPPMAEHPEAQEFARRLEEAEAPAS